LDHLITMTDDVGVFQHARYDVPNRDCGYCTDDVGRALIVAIDATYRRATEAPAAKLAATYLAYLSDAQRLDGWFHNFMGYDRRWQDQHGSADSFGRAIWGLGYAAARAPRDSWRRLAAELAGKALGHIEELPFLRSRAYAALGLVHLAGVDQRAVSLLRTAVDPLVAAYQAVASSDWRWCEETLTYDNGRLCEALIRAGGILHDDAFVQTGLEMLDFYAGIVVEDGTFVPVGNQGWYPRGGPRARFGQQPLEAAAFVEAALAAHAATGDQRYRGLAQIGYDWYWGRNSRGVLMVTNGGCRDGIDEHGVSPNMGAESTLAYLMSALAMTETRTQSLRIAR
jgi:hypothetical protein